MKDSSSKNKCDERSAPRIPETKNELLLWLMTNTAVKRETMTGPLDSTAN